MARREHFMEHHDGLRKLLLTEPRGYPCQNANVILPPSPASPHAAYGFVILEQGKIYPAMSGHNTICVVTALLETGMVEMVEPVTRFHLEAPGGPIAIEATCSGGRVIDVTFENLPAFVGALGVTVDVPHGVGEVTVDIAYGGMW